MPKISKADQAKKLDDFLGTEKVGGAVRLKKRGGDVTTDILKAVAPIAIDAGTSALKRHIGLGVKKRHHKKKGGDLLDSIGRVAEPIIANVGSKMLEKYLAGDGVKHHGKHTMLSVHLTKPMIKKLMKGGAVDMSVKNLKEQGKHLLKLAPEKAEELLKSLAEHPKVKMALGHGEELIHKLTGGAQVADPMDLVNKYAPKIAESAIGHLLTGIGMKSKKKAVRGRGGSPYVSAPYKNAMVSMDTYGGDLLDSIANGFKSVGKPYEAMVGVNPVSLGMDIGENYLGPALMNAGVGRGLKHHYAEHGIDGIRQSMDTMSMPIQLGSPYQHIGSPAMRPFQAHSPQTPNLIPHTMGGSISPAGGGDIFDDAYHGARSLLGVGMRRKHKKGGDIGDDIYHGIRYAAPLAGLFL